MSRTRSYAKEDVVRAARTVFWNEGYEQTGIAELEAATGLNRSSIYHAFGSKRGLFDEAVQSYFVDIVHPRLARLRAVPVPPDALRAYLHELRVMLLNGNTSLAANGCLLLNATGTPLAHEAALRSVINTYCDDLGEAITAGVLAARPHLDPAERARISTTCTGLVFAAMAIVTVNPQSAADMIDAAIAAIDTDAHSELARH
ncbi:TetR/AcrR family transcriptional regulator [Lacisediminihabitans sp.]|uniref:TetR/AcrR family transcriptional regulator n=1 Tax=Lacisediminihabitans sp. TaxID=2787631 RepID=UPI00374DA0B2